MDCRGQVPHVRLQTAQPAPLPARLLPATAAAPPETLPKKVRALREAAALLSFAWVFLHGHGKLGDGKAEAARPSPMEGVWERRGGAHLS